jgi:hypothetical protein
MPSPKKKLPTGPIRIENPLSKHSEIFPPSTEAQQIREPSLAESSLQEVIKQDSILKDNGLASSQDNFAKDRIDYDAQSHNNNKQESSNQDYQKQESSFSETKNNLETNPIAEEVEQQIPYTKQESIKQEYNRQEYDIQEIEYKKVAMRLSAEAVNRLRELRTVTELPYEVLVDVMIRNWDTLPAKIQKQYLSEAKQSRIQRLIAGQDKAMTTVRKRLKD